MKKPKKLAKPYYDRVNALLDKGNEQLDQDKMEKALDTFKSALALIPVPKDDYEIAYLVYASIGDAHFFSSEFDEGLAAFERAQEVFGGIHGHYEPFLMLRTGQSLFVIADRDEDEVAQKRAFELLSKALEVAGVELFEDEDPIFLEFAKTGVMPEIDETEEE